MIQLLPVRLSYNGRDGADWKAEAETYSFSAIGKTPEEALARITSIHQKSYPNDSIELTVTALEVTFPRGVPYQQFVDLGESLGSSSLLIPSRI